MAIISLRAYNHEIEGMIDNGQLDEAVGHCRHILATFPKHIASYRLLGKAHLEQQRISDATDIFQRVLTAIPDDFISNVGMSIIREDENNLDAAIWHMELAYEAQPANIAIQDELRRLYGRRDGMQPPKVRLTRGALARMYAKGGLYDQAIAELRAAIAEDPNRPDLQILLAQMFYQTSQRVEAVDTCVNIIKKIPLCLEANRILAVSLPETEGSDAVKNYRQTVISMDPYYAFAEPEAISSEQVPENAVNIERLEWKSGIQIGETPDQPNWATSLGISMDKPTEEKIPDWLKSAEAPSPGSTDEKAAPVVSPFIWDTQEVEKIITDTSKPEGDIPDWMKDAGWKPTTGETTPPTEETKPQEPMPEPAASNDLEKANLPEWLQGIAPEGVLGSEKQDVLPKEGDLSNPWLEPHQPGPTDSIIQWLEEKKPEAPATPPTQGENLGMGLEEEMPDWLKDIELPQTTPTQEEKPVELTPAFTSEPSAFKEETAKPESPEAMTEVTPSEETVKPALEAQPSPTETVIPPEISEPKAPSAVIVDEIPDWLKEIAAEMPATDAFVPVGKESITEAPLVTEPELSTTPPPAPEEAPTEEMPTATEGITAQPAPETAEALPEVEVSPAAEVLPSAVVAPITEEVPTIQPPEMADALPIAEVPLSMEVQPSMKEESISAEIPTAEQPVVVEALPEAETPAPAENLPTAEKASISEGIPSMELPTTEVEVPAQEQPKAVEALPEAGVPAIAEQLPTAELASISEVTTTEPPASAEELPAAVILPVPPEQPQAEQPLPVEGEQAVAEPGLSQESEAFAWLEGLVGEQTSKTEELIAPTAEGEITPPEWVKLESEPTTEKVLKLEPQAGEETPAVPAGAIPEWIKGLGEEPKIEPAPEAPVSAAPPATEIPKAEELPAWLQEVEQPAEELMPPISPTGVLEWKEDKLPAWLKEIPESKETEEAPAAMEVHPAGETPVIMVEPTAERTVEIIPPAETGEKALEEPVEEIKPPISPTGVLEWKEDTLPAWLKEITETAPSNIVPATMQLPSAEEVPFTAKLVSPEKPPVTITKESVVEALVPTDERPSSEEPKISEEEPITSASVTPQEIPATEASFLAEEQAQIEQPIAAESELAAEAPAIPAEGIPEWIKGLGEISEIENVSEESISATSTETETPQVTEPPPAQHELEQPVEEIKPPFTPTGVLEWKEEELPAWLKEITETIPAEEAAATIETHLIEKIPTVSVEASSVSTEIIVPPLDTGEKAVEGLQPVTGPWVPEVAEQAQPVPAIPIETEAKPAPVMEELPTTEVEIAPTAPPVQAEIPVEMVSDVDKSSLADARNAITQGEPSQAAGIYTGLIKRNYHIDEIIKDLHEALYRFPVDVGMWVTLGDAHHRSSNLQEALNAYTKAEELVR